MSKKKTPAGNGNKSKPVAAKTPVAKAAETQPEETKAPETQPEETKAPETQPEETKAPETQPKGKDKNEDPRIVRAREVFKSHNTDKVYFTVDDTCFIEPQYAHMHAASIKNEKVDVITRKETE
jgi:hypothetical protein